MTAHPAPPCSAPRSPLSGRRVVVTRPSAQAMSLCRRLAAVGAETLNFPCIAIAPPRDHAAADALARRLHEYDLAIYISANAVEQAFDRYGQPPPGVSLAVIGRASGAALARFGVAADIVPAAPPFDSEALLAHPALAEDAVAGKRVIIFRGEGGRGLLADALNGRGARVDYAEVYRRTRPRPDPRPLLELWRRGEIFAVTALSNETLQNLVEAVTTEGRPHLLATPLAVASPRAAALAAELGWSAPVIVAEDAGDEAITAALVTLAGSED